jgi:hypothetical protein
MWAAVEAVSRHLNIPVSRLVVLALSEYGPVAMYLRAVDDMAGLAPAGPVDNRG